MPDSVIASTREEIRDAFHLNLIDQPLAGRIANTVLFGELVSDGTVLVFGGYDLVLCHGRQSSRDGEACYTTVVPRTFVERISLGAAVMPGKTLQIRVSVWRPLQARLRAGRPSKIKFWDLLKSMIWDGTWMEILVEGEITVEVLSAGESISEMHSAAIPGTTCNQEVADDKQERENTKDVAGGVLRENRRGKTAKKRDDEITIELDALADLIIDIIRRRRGDLAAGETSTGPSQNVRSAVRGSGVMLPEHRSGGNQGKEHEMPRAITPEMLTELMRKVIREYEEEKSTRAPAVSSEPVKGARVLTNTDLTAMPLDQIPSRPGLYQTFTQNLPPPKPQGSGS